MANANFTIEATASQPPGYDATLGQTLTLQLEDQPALDITSTRYSVGQYSKGAPALTFSGSGVPATPQGTVTVTMPGSGMHTYQLICTTSDGTRTYITSRIVAIRSVGGLRKILAAESTEYDPTFGWADALNEALDASASAAGVVAPDPNTIAKRGAAGQLYGTRFAASQTGIPTIGLLSATAAAQAFVTYLYNDGIADRDKLAIWHDGANALWLGKDSATNGPATVGLMCGSGATYSIHEGRHLFFGSTVDLGPCALVTPWFVATGTIVAGSPDVFTPDLENGSAQTVVLSGDTTIANPANVTVGGTYKVHVVLTAGTEAVSWGANYIFDDQHPNPLPVAGGSGTVFYFEARDVDAAGILHCVDRSWDASQTQVGTGNGGITTLLSGTIKVEVNDGADTAFIGDPTASITIDRGANEIRSSAGTAVKLGSSQIAQIAVTLIGGTKTQASGLDLSDAKIVGVYLSAINGSPVQGEPLVAISTNDIVVTSYIGGAQAATDVCTYTVTLIGAV